MSEVKHTPEPWVYCEEGDANKYHIVSSGNWVLALLHNGEQATDTQRANLNRIVDCVNALEGVPNESIKDVARMVKPGGWHEHLAYMRQLETEREQLLNTLEDIQKTLAGETTSEKQTHAYALADGALEHFKGSQS